MTDGPAWSEWEMVVSNQLNTPSTWHIQSKPVQAFIGEVDGPEQMMCRGQ